MVLFYCSTLASLANSITRNRKRRDVTALVLVGVDVFLLLFALMGTNECLRFPMNVGWCIKIRNTHFENAISLMFTEVPNELVTTFFR